ncbi:cyclase family protein [Lysinibacillus sphaericus]|uniref:Cyclase family protein n=1 Tax=Lysinibacillus sphaericus TaxID=1421 RepID=A0A544UQ13_LYSSH|nr:cyclase family protein [Lysinibacillus sp. SDF0037]TQR35938.1 cyclase family protein [Lysinibacillus sp. SDF0037]
MKIIDLTHTLTEKISVYPGTDQPSLKIICNHESDGFKETALTLTSHTGTHMDAPNHIFKDGITLDLISVEQFVGKGLVIDCSDLTEGQKITLDRINKVKKGVDQADFLLFYTGWDQYWGTDKYFGDYPHMTEEVAEYLIQSNKKGVGLDVISIDSMTSLTNHKKVLFDSNFVIVENLTKLGEIGNELFTFYALPMKYENADGAPVRAIAIL